VFPFASADVPGPVAPASVLYGLNLVTGGPALWDRWSQENHNSILLARSGAGKSYLTKCEVLRQLYQGVQVTILDPEDEYTDLAAHVGGTIRRPGGPDAALNPLELRDTGRPDALARRCLFVRTVVETLLGEKLDSAVAARLIEAVRAAYTEQDITDDSETWSRPVPTLADVVRLLAASSDGSDLAARISPYTGPGSMFALTETRTESAGPLKVWVLADVPDELRPVVTLVVLDQVTPPVRSDGRWHLIVVDEAWTWLKEREGAEFIAALAKSARKRLVGLAVVTQDADDVLSSQLGRTVLNNAATQLLMRQAPQAIDTVAEACKLTGAERSLVASARVGETLLVSGETHVAFRAVASETEHRLCLTGRSRFQAGGAR
jgi:type IV secretory pathway VirB4 component